MGDRSWAMRLVAVVAQLDEKAQEMNSTLWPRMNEKEHRPSGSLAEAVLR
jgi:hypothetical protein